MKKVLIQNKKAGFNYEILEKLEAGVQLFGFEVKSLKGAHGSLDGAYVTIRDNEIFLVNANIPPYQALNTPESYAPRRDRKLLLNKKEIGRLVGFVAQKGLTMVPLSVYNNGRKLKVEIAVARGKKKYDKRESIKARDDKRKIERTLKYQ